mmetsp:Transcript_35274/g.112490  ORF Transcript_35274/g.112490 Transcript_35274/m.112490 type:complete len:257 (-) Transcript_35274:171-941(-)
MLPEGVLRLHHRRDSKLAGEAGVRVTSGPVIHVSRSHHLIKVRMHPPKIFQGLRIVQIPTLPRLATRVAPSIATLGGRSTPVQSPVDKRKGPRHGRRAHLPPCNERAHAQWDRQFEQASATTGQSLTDRAELRRLAGACTHAGSVHTHKPKDMHKHTNKHTHAHADTHADAHVRVHTNTPTHAHSAPHTNRTTPHRTAKHCQTNTIRTRCTNNNCVTIVGAPIARTWLQGLLSAEGTHCGRLTVQGVHRAGCCVVD